jgi:hypothetical protein
MRVYHYDKVCWALENIRQRRLKLSRFDNMNDPYEWRCVSSSHEPSQRSLDKAFEGAVNGSGLLCFSRSWKNILMWSHYADRHSGICLGFDVPDKFANNVVYIGDLRVIGDLEGLSTVEVRRVHDQQYHFKYIDWSYEEEVRVHGRADTVEHGKGFTNFGEHLQLKEVIAGARFSESMGLIEDALKGNSEGVTIYKAVTSPSGFEIVRDKHGFSAI